MIIDRSHIRWAAGAISASAGLTILYLANCHPKELPFTIPLPACFGHIPPLSRHFGASPLGLTYGILALLIFIFAALLGWRRNHPSWRIGSLQLWLKAHIWFTILTFPLVLFHSDFRAGGPLTTLLVVLYTLVMVSGVWGLLLQHIVPRLMREYLPDEVIFEQIAHIRDLLLEQARVIRTQLVTQADQIEPLPMTLDEGATPVPGRQATGIRAIIHFLDTEGLPFLATPKTRRMRMRQHHVSDNLFRLLRLQVPAATLPPLEELQNLCDEKRRLDLQTRLQHWLHSWLFVHAPVSLILIVVSIWHALVAAFIYA